MRAGPVALLVAALGVVGLPALSAPAAASTLPEADVGALQAFGACLSEHGRGDLLLLIDESGSLTENDPDDARVEAASYLVDQIHEAGASGGFTLDVSVAAFSHDVDPALGWTTLDASGLDQVQETVESFADREDGLETDYWNAIEKSRRLLADKAAQDRADAAAEVATGQQVASSCQALAWFSDGALDIEPRSSQARIDRMGRTKAYAPGLDITDEGGAVAAEQAATESLCREGGLADQLRAAGVITLGVGLAADSSQDAGFELMRSVVTGAGESISCGGLVEPVPGEFVLASDLRDLLFAVDPLGNPGQLPVVQKTGVCQGEVCAEHAHVFVLDDSIQDVHILASLLKAPDGSEVLEASDVRAVLVAPDGSEVDLVRGGAPAADPLAAAVTHEWKDAGAVSVDMSDQPAAGGWSGAWSLVFVDDTASSPEALSRSNIHLTGNIFPSAQLPQKLVAGQASDPVILGLEDSDGAPIDPKQLLGTLSMSAVLLQPGGQEVVLGESLTAAELGAGFPVDLTDSSVGPAMLRLALDLTTAAATTPDGSTVPGTALAPQLVDVPVEVVPPPGYPKVVTTLLDFGTTEGAAGQSAALLVEGPGCVWAGEESVSLKAFPQEVGDVVVAPETASSPEACLELAEGEQADLELTLTTDEAGNGSVNGTVMVSLAPLGEPDRATEAEVDFVADLRKPLDEGTFVAGLLLALLLGVAIPFGLLYLLKAVTARIPPRALAAALVPVEVDDGTVRRDGRPFEIRDTDMVGLVRLSSGGARVVEAAGTTLRTRVGRSPFGPATVLVDAPGMVGASDAHPRPYGPQRRARLPLAVHNTWAVLVDPQQPADRASVLLLVAADASRETREKLAEQVRRRVPELVGPLREEGTGAGPHDDTSAPAPVATGFDRFRNQSSTGSTVASAGSGRSPTPPAAGPGSRRDPFDFSPHADGGTP